MRVLLGAAAIGVLTLGCGNGVSHNWPPSYNHDTIHLGVARREAGARAAALAGAGRAAFYGPEAVISNPAALAVVSAPAVSGGTGYISSDLTVQPTAEDPRAQTFFGSWSPSHVSAALPVVPKRFVVGASAWQPYDYNYDMAGGVKGRGGVYAVGPAAAVDVGGFRLGIAGDYLFGYLTLNADRIFPAYERATASGFSARGAVARTFEFDEGWSLTPAAIAYWGGRINFNGGTRYVVKPPAAAALAFSLRARSINVHVDYVYQFTTDMTTDEPAVASAIAASARDAGWASAGGEFVTPSGAVARGGVSYRPWYVNDAFRRAVHGWYYGIGGGWPTWSRRGRVDVALQYGRRGAGDDAGYVMSDIAFQVGLNYYW